jgi:hypothetical protein
VRLLIWCHDATVANERGVPAGQVDFVPTPGGRQAAIAMAPPQPSAVLPSAPPTCGTAICAM